MRREEEGEKGRGGEDRRSSLHSLLDDEIPLDVSRQERVSNEGKEGMEREGFQSIS